MMDSLADDSTGGVPTAGAEVCKEELNSIALPAAAIKRIVKNIVPGASFSKEALAGLHRVVQAYCVYANECAMEQMRQENTTMRKVKGKATVVRKTLSPDHYMRFLSKEFPPLATKIATLFPDIMPAEFKPPAVQLLQELHVQERDAAKNAFEASETTLASDQAQTAAQPRSLADAFAQVSLQEPDGIRMDDVPKATPAPAPAESSSSTKRSAAADGRRAEEGAKKRPRTSRADAAPPGASLKAMFGASTTRPPEQAEPGAADPAGEGATDPAMQFGAVADPAGEGESAVAPGEGADAGLESLEGPMAGE